MADKLNGNLFDHMKEWAKKIAEDRATETQESWDKGTTREPKPVIKNPRKA